MSIFDLNEPVISKVELAAKEFIREANETFQNQLEASYKAVENFWYMNRDQNWLPSAIKCDPVPGLFEGSYEPTGPEILTQMGTNAAGIMLVAYKRVEMLLEIEAALGLSGIVDLSRLIPPYTCTYNIDGSLDTATLN